MRKFKIPILTLILSLGCGSAMAFSQAESGLTDWFQPSYEHEKQGVTTVLMDDSSAIEEQMLQHLDAEVNNIKQEADQKNKTHVLHAEQQLDNYKKDYLNHLAVIQETLENKDFETYRKNKEQEIRQTIRTDVETYLDQLLSD
ncbi:hypothetical protein [Lentibacillus salicampi]|uniref:Uncharacterized protein n=1 Tax=Lentibacillus salicampi TaxID=175306 RepID=A0A4Y9AGC5_9BACI|nr:hypothetical protein [Lentibacillus salicampi]TFJ94422.1 hypothetical protein E4U82_00455 [Lentibacillus salicampi]